MAIKIAKRAWHSSKMDNDWQRFANYFGKHYPMDKQMAKYFREAMKSTENCAAKLKTASKPKTATKRKTTAKKRTAPKRRTTMKRKTTTTKRRTTAKRRTPAKTSRWSAAKKRTMKRRRA
jgi:stringent starvation protein B